MSHSIADDTPRRGHAAADALLPHRFSAGEAVAGDDALLSLVVDENHAVVRRRLSGVAMTMVIPIAAFSGVGVRISDDLDEITFELVHTDPGLTLPLGKTETVDEAARLLDGWSTALRLPRLFVDRDGRATAIEAAIADAPAPRPRPRAPILHVHQGGLSTLRR